MHISLLLFFFFFQKQIISIMIINTLGGHLFARCAIYTFWYTVAIILLHSPVKIEAFWDVNLFIYFIFLR